MIKHILLLSGIIAVYGWLARGTAWLGPYTYDEADYMYAVSLGWQANWMDTPTLGLPQFLELGLHRNGKEELSDLIRNSGDVVFYRHWHGPLYGNWLAAASRFAADEASTRALHFIFPVAVAIVMYVGALYAIPGAAGQIAAILAPALYVWGFPVVRTTELAPHHLFALCASAGLLLLMNMFRPGANARRCWYLAVVLAALSFCVLEVAFALILTVACCGYAARRSLEFDVTLAARSIGLFLATVLLLWPAAILKVSFLKAYLFMAYLAIVRRGAWGDVSGATTWWLRVSNSPVPWLLLLVGVVLVGKQWRKALFLVPPAIFSVIMFLALFRVNTALPRYTLPILPGVTLFAAAAAGLVMARWGRAMRYAGVLILLAAMIATSAPGIRAKMPAPNTRAEAMLAIVREHAGTGGTLLAPHDDVPMLHYYFPGLRFGGYYDEAAIPEDLRSGAAGVIYGGTRPRFVPSTAVRN
jgi:hypothetical protein